MWPSMCMSVLPVVQTAAGEPWPVPAVQGPGGDPGHHGRRVLVNTGLRMYPVPVNACKAPVTLAADVDIIII